MAAKSASNWKNSFLFTNEDGSPMVFVITPGDTKKRLRPIVETGGGVVTSKETPGAIRLVAPDYGSGKQLVCSDFVFDSYKNGTLCNIDDYRLESKPDVASPKIHVTVNSEKAVQNGRIKYGPEEDQAILDYIKKFEGQDIKLSGNKIWKEMEDKKVTCHRWQSMRSRYLSFLRQSTSSYFKGKLEFVESKNISRSQNANIAEVSAYKKTNFSSHSNVTVNKERKDKENVHASLPNDQRTITSVKDNCEKSSSGMKHNVNILDESESSGSNIKENMDSCVTGIRKYFKAQSKDITSDEVKSGNELSDVPQDMLCDHDNKDNTDDCNHGNQSTGDCEPVLKCNQLFENYKKLQMISKEIPCGTQTPTLAQILHALYVSCGCLECALHYLQTGMLPDGQEIWKREEDTAINSDDAVAIKKIIDKRGQKAVNIRKQFLSSF